MWIPCRFLNRAIANVQGEVHGDIFRCFKKSYRVHNAVECDCVVLGMTVWDCVRQGITSAPAVPISSYFLPQTPIY